MKIWFTDRCYANAAGLHPAPYIKKISFARARTTDAKHRVQVRMEDHGSKISPSILLSGTSNFTANNGRCYTIGAASLLEQRAKWLFFGGGCDPSTGRLNPFRNVSGARRVLAALHDTISDVNQLKGRNRNNAQSRDQLGPMQSRSVTSDAARMCDWSTGFIGISVTSNFSKKIGKNKETVYERKCCI